MERITKWNGKKFVLPQGRGSFREIAERLAAYENTGLEPSEIQALVGECNKGVYFVNFHVEGECTIPVVADSYEEAVKIAQDKILDISFSHLTEISSTPTSMSDCEGNERYL